MNPNFSAPRPSIIVALFAAMVMALTAADAQELASPPKPKPKPKTPPPPAEALAWMKEITEIPPGSYANLDPVSLRFNLSWNNVLNAGELNLALQRDEGEVENLGPLLIGKATGKSSGLARVLWPYDFEAEAKVDSGTLRPHLFELSESERGKSVEYHLDFQPGKVVSETTVHPKEDEEEIETKRRVYRYEFLHDILSVALYVRSHDLAEGESIKALVSPFNRPYHVEFTHAGSDTRKIKRKKYDTLKYEVAIRKVNHDKTLQDYDKMKKATIWFSDDEFRLPVEVHADIFVGFVSARMKDRAWLAKASASAE